MKPARSPFTMALALIPAFLALGLTACSRDPVPTASADSGSAPATPKPAESCCSVEFGEDEAI